MGDPRKFHKKFERPPIEWDSQRIKEESLLKQEFGLKNSKEIWKARAILRNLRGNARRLLAQGERGEAEARQILQRALRYGILKPAEGRETTLDDILALDVRDVLDRRLQTRVFKKGLARTIKQARQLVVHGFISVNGRKMTSPSYLVPLEEEDSISYYKPIDVLPKVAPEATKDEGKNDEGDVDGGA